MELAGPLVEKAAKRRRKKGGKQMRRKERRPRHSRPLRTATLILTRPKPVNQRPNEPRSQIRMGIPPPPLDRKRHDGERQRPFPICGLSDDVCECSVLSDATYSSTNEYSLIEESTSVE
ncbi:hypothetical protein HPB50_028051 [Hyalomma asiaticum]|nr:hypothetical protein HPB50_028051 [Hyalomma asiaticum]